MPSRRSLISSVTVTLVVGVGGGVAPAALASASAGTAISRCCSTGGQQQGSGLDRNDRAHFERLVGGLDRLTNTVERASTMGKTSASGSRTIDRNDRAHFQAAKASRGVVEHRSGI